MIAIANVFFFVFKEKLTATIHKYKNIGRVSHCRVTIRKR